MNGPSYRFRLERVRALRERREAEAKQKLAAALAGRELCEQQLNLASARIDAARGAQLNADAAELQAHQAYLERVERAHREQTEAMQRHEAAVKAQRHQLITASLERQTLERLKEKGHAAYVRDSARIEQNWLDELAGNRYRRNLA